MTDRPTLSRPARSDRPDSGDPTDRLSRARLAALRPGRTSRPTDPLSSRHGTLSVLSTSNRLLKITNSGPSTRSHTSYFFRNVA